MIYELRTYTLRPGTVPQFSEVFDKEIRPVSTKHKLNLVGFWHTEIGELNQVVHLWAFEDLNQRAEQRGAFLQDSAMTPVLPRIRDMQVHQESKILIPAAFSPLK